jgi:catalase
VTHEQWAGKAVQELFQEINDDDFVQAKGLWDVLGRTPGQQDNYVSNVAGHLSAAHVDTRNRTYAMFSRVDQSLGNAIKEQTEKLVK